MSDDTFTTNVAEVWGSVKKWFKTKKKLFNFYVAKKRDKLKLFMNGKDFIAVKRGLFTILMDGLFISGLLYPLIGFKLILVPSFGAGWFWLKNDGIKQLVKIISSINLIKIGK